MTFVKIKTAILKAVLYDELKDNLDILLKLRGLVGDSITIDGVNYNITQIKNYKGHLDETFQLPRQGDQLLEKLVKDKITFSQIKNAVNTLKNKQEMLFENFQKKDSILTMLTKLNKNELTIDGEVFSFKALLAIKDWNKDLSTAAKKELITLYKLINDKDKLQKIEKAIDKLKVSDKKTSGLSRDAKIGIAIGVSVFVLLSVGLGFFYWNKQKQSKST